MIFSKLCVIFCPKKYEREEGFHYFCKKRVENLRHTNQGEEGKGKERRKKDIKALQLEADEERSTETRHLKKS